MKKSPEDMSEVIDEQLEKFDRIRNVVRVGLGIGSVAISLNLGTACGPDYGVDPCYELESTFNYVGQECNGESWSNVDIRCEEVDEKCNIDKYMECMDFGEAKRDYEGNCHLNNELHYKCEVYLVPCRKK